MIKFASICIMLFALACLAMGFHIIEISNTEIMTASSIDHMYWTFGTLLILSSIFFGICSINVWFKKL